MAEPIYSVFGSGEFLPWSEAPDRYALERAREGDSSVLIIPAASAPEGDDTFNNWANLGIKHYERLGIPARVSGIKTRDHAFSDYHVAQIEGASLVYFSGGNPKYLADVMRDTPFWKAVLDAADRGVAVAGCSAGACILGEIAPDTTDEGDVDRALATPGLRVMPGIAFGPHWDMIDHYRPGLSDSIRDKMKRDLPGTTLVTLDENTAIVGDGSEWLVFGAGEVGIVKDGEKIAAYREGATFSF